jgi:ABC-type dipeptide/oligopeptide/nickel transport system permease component
MPSFIIAPLLILFFSLKLDLLPVSGNGDLSSIILPTVSLGISLGAVLANMTRASLLEVLNSDFITTARAKGVGEREIFLKHALKNALTPIITTISFQFGAVLTGVVITETIFDWPGIGVLLYSALQSRNYPLVQGCVLTIAMLYILVNLVTDVLYFVVNPRLRET